MKKYFIFFFVIQRSFFVFSQTKKPGFNILQQGEALYCKGDYQESILKFNRCVTIFKQFGEIQLLSKTYNDLGRSLSQIGKSEDALKSYFLSVVISKQINDSLSLAKTYKNIGALYEEQKDFDKAMQFYNSSFTIARQTNNLILMADCENNMGVVFEQQIKYKKALLMYSKALEIYKSKNDNQKISMVLNNLAIIYKCLKKYPQAIKNYEAALILSEKLGDKFMVAANQNNLGNVYILTGNYNKALELCMLANKNAKAINANEVNIESYDGVSIAYEKLNKFTDAIKYRKLYEKEKDKFINTDRNKQLAEIQTKYETQKKTDEIILLNQESKIRNFKIKHQELLIKSKNYQILAFVIFVNGLFIIAFFWKKSQKFKHILENEKIINQTEEQERLRIAKDIHDDLGSGLTKINFLSEIILQKTLHLPDIRSSSEAVKETAVKMIDNMRDLIWALNPDNTKVANLLARMREYSTDYLEDYPIETQNHFPQNLPQTPITKEAHRELFMVVKESFNNIVKYSKATKVLFTAKIEFDYLKFIINDNGVGFNIDTVIKGNGLRNMQSRLASIDGTCTINSNNKRGTEIIIEVPLAKIIKNIIPF